MGKNDWLDAYEAVERENPQATADQLDALAEARVIDLMAAEADRQRDEAKYGGSPFMNTERGLRDG